MASDASESKRGRVEKDRRNFLKMAGSSGLIASTSMLAGCGGDGDGGGDSGDGGDGGDGGDAGGDDVTGTRAGVPPGDDVDTATSGGDGDGGEETATPSESEISRGGSVTIGIPINVQGISGSLLPHFYPDSADMISKLSYLWQDRLISFDGAQPVGRLATDWEWQDNTTFVWTLREGVQFHNDYGEMTAEDWVRMFHENLVPGRPSKFWQQFDGVIVGSDIDQTIEEAVQQTGEYEFIVNVPETTSSLIYPFGSHATGVFPSDFFDEMEGDDFRGIMGVGTEPGPTGTGPFVHEEQLAQNRISFSKFDDYWDDETSADGEALPYLDSIEVNLSQNAQSRYTALTTGQTDVAATLPTNRVPDMEQQSGIRPITREGTRLLRYAFNHTFWEPARDINFKRAIAFAIDKESMNEAIMSGQAATNHLHVPPWMNVAEQVTGMDGYEEFPFDPEQAQAELEESDWGPDALNNANTDPTASDSMYVEGREYGSDGVEESSEVPLDATMNSITEQEVERDATVHTIAEQNLSDLGYNINTYSLIFSEGFNTWQWDSGTPEFDENGHAVEAPEPPYNQHMLLYGHDRVVPDPNNWVGQIGYGVATANNRPHWVGPNGMETVNEALQATDRETINDFWAERVLEANQGIPEVSCIWYPRVWGAADYVHNVEQEPFGQYNLKRMWIENE